jgi:transmembrane sensor
MNTTGVKGRGVPEIPAKVARQAVAWMLELRTSPQPEAVLAALESWRGQHPMHELAWRRMEIVRSRLSGAAQEAALAHATLGPLGSKRRSHAVKALAVLFFAGTTAAALKQRQSWSEIVADHRTAVGEQRRVTLPDGTELMLNTATAVDLLFTESERRVRLITGEIHISTAQDPHRTFLVQTQQGVAQPLGTRFTVEIRNAVTKVAVFEGAVKVVPADAKATVLKAGQEGSFSRTAVQAALSTRNTSSPPWTDGSLLAKAMRLDDFLRELGRYSPHPLSCDPAVASFRVSGSFPVANVPLALEAMSATFSLEIETVTRFWGKQVVGYRLVPRAL